MSKEHLCVGKNCSFSQMFPLHAVACSVLIFKHSDHCSGQFVFVHQAEQKCFTCDSRLPYDRYSNPTSHRIENIITNFDLERKLKWWQSENGKFKVNSKLSETGKHARTERCSTLNVGINTLATRMFWFRCSNVFGFDTWALHLGSSWSVWEKRWWTQY